MLDILTRITQGKGVEGDIEELERLGNIIKKTALCGLGQTAPNPVLSTIRHFRDEYEAHIRGKRCPSLVCRKLVQYSIDAETCNGCTACARACPASCISGEKKEVHVIDPTSCIHCGTCFDVCTFDAVLRA
jgi:NADH-quinone oxidoreductase subunit F